MADTRTRLVRSAVTRRHGRPRLRAAIVLHGKLGAIDRGQGWSRAVDGAIPTIDVAVIAHASIVRHIFETNRAGYTFDVFGHSWSPDMGPVLDAMFSPRESRHEREESARNRRLCDQIALKLRQVTAATGAAAQFSHYGMVGRGASSCSRTASHMLGMTRAILLKASFEARHAFQYDLVLVSRWDVVWNRPVLLHRVDLSQHAFTIPQFCVHSRGIDHRSQLERNLSSYRKGICGGLANNGLIPTASVNCHPSHRPCSHDLSQRARELYLLDWWFISDSVAATRFARAGDADLFANYTLVNQEHLNAAHNARPTIMGHAYWGLHMIWGLSAPLRFTGYVGLDFTLARMWQRGGCKALQERCKGRLCTDEDVLHRPWQSDGLRQLLPPWSSRPRQEFRYGARETWASCGEGYFTCSDRSKMCQEEFSTYEPMDSNAGRSKWIACTADLCKRLGTDRYSVRCAGAMLAAWTAVWRHSPPPNLNLSTEVRDAGFFAQGMFGWYDPSHAAAAMANLTRHASEMFHNGPQFSGAVSSPLIDHVFATKSGTVRSPLHDLHAVSAECRKLVLNTSGTKPSKGKA